MKNLTEYISEAYDPQLSKNKELIDKYFSNFTISTPHPVKRQKNYKKYFDYGYRCEIFKKEQIEPFYDALYKLYDEIGQKYKKEDRAKTIELEKKTFDLCLAKTKEFSDSLGISMDNMPVASIPFCIQTKPEYN